MIDLFMGAGWIGVDLFFVLSGFLITGILLATKESPVYYKSFFARRFLRIFPLYYLLLGLTIIKYHSFFNRFDIASLIFFYYNWQAVHLGHHLFAVNSLWSLAVEEQFYLLWPSIVLFLDKRALARLSVAGIFVALLLRLVILPQSTGFQSAYYLTPCRMDALLVGALIAIWHTEPEVWKRVRRYANRAIVGSSALLLSIAIWTGHFYDFVTRTSLDGLQHYSLLVLGPGCTLLAILFGALIVKCTGQGYIFHLFNFYLARRIGKYSYGMYMLHWPILIAIDKYLPTSVIELPWNGGSIISFIILVGTSFGMAMISFHTFEKYFLKLKRRFPAS